MRTTGFQVLILLSRPCQIACQSLGTQNSPKFRAIIAATFLGYSKWEQGGGGGVSSPVFWSMTQPLRCRAAFELQLWSLAHQTRPWHTLGNWDKLLESKWRQCPVDPWGQGSGLPQKLGTTGTGSDIPQSPKTHTCIDSRLALPSIKP